LREVSSSQTRFMARQAEHVSHQKPLTQETTSDNPATAKEDSDLSNPIIRDEGTVFDWGPDGATTDNNTMRTWHIEVQVPKFTFNGGKYLVWQIWCPRRQEAQEISVTSRPSPAGCRPIL
jgi:hypothetical protein